MKLNHKLVKVLDTVLWIMLWLTMLAILIGGIFGAYDIVFGALV